MAGINPKRWIIEMKKTWPHHHLVRDYDQQAKAGMLPRLADLMKLGLSFSTWRANRRGARVFGFKSQAELTEFQQKLTSLDRSRDSA